MFFRRSKPLQLTQAAKPLYGVNLGGWLLVEKGMTSSLFAGTDALDEYSLCQQLDEHVAQKLREHRETFITRADFEWLAPQGITAVRLPVGYRIFGGEESFPGTITYVDKAFAWAGATGIKILLDLHGTPGSQNGKQESGRIGGIGWPRDTSKKRCTKCRMPL